MLNLDFQYVVTVDSAKEKMFNRTSGLLKRYREGFRAENRCIRKTDFLLLYCHLLNQTLDTGFKTAVHSLPVFPTHRQLDRRSNLSHLVRLL